MIQAIVFDFDGLILDTETAEFGAWQEIYCECGVELSLDLWIQCVGTDSGFDPYEDLGTRMGKGMDREAISVKSRANYQRLIAKELLRPGVTDYLSAAKQLGLSIGLASSSKREWVTGYLSQFGILDYFDCIKVKEDVAKVKPDPELYIQVVQGLNLQPHNVIAFEDSPNGARAAVAAGLHCVIVPNFVTRTFPFDAYDLRLDSMKEKSLEEVLQRFNH